MAGNHPFFQHTKVPAFAISNIKKRGYAALLSPKALFLPGQLKCRCLTPMKGMVENGFRFAICF